MSAVATIVANHARRPRSVGFHPQLCAAATFVATKVSAIRLPPEANNPRTSEFIRGSSSFHRKLQGLKATPILVESSCRFDGAFGFLFFKPPMDTDKYGYRNLHSRLFASIRGSKFSNQ